MLLNGSITEGGNIIHVSSFKLNVWHDEMVYKFLTLSSAGLWTKAIYFRVRPVHDIENWMLPYKGSMLTVVILLNCFSYFFYITTYYILL
jgi:hypothetical protein